MRVYPSHPRMYPTDDSLHLAAAKGFALRKEWLEAHHELEAISLNGQSSETILSLKVQIFCGLEKWKPMEIAAKRLVATNAHSLQWIVALACAKRLNGDDAEATSLLAGIFDRPPRGGFPGLLYQLAAYACSLGEPVTAEVCLKRAIPLRPNLLELAREDPDLKLVRDCVKEWL